MGGGGVATKLNHVCKDRHDLSRYNDFVGNQTIYATAKYARFKWCDCGVLLRRWSRAILGFPSDACPYQKNGENCRLPSLIFLIKFGRFVTHKLLYRWGSFRFSVIFHYSIFFRVTVPSELFASPREYW